MSQPSESSGASETPLALPAPPEERTRTLNVQEGNSVTIDELGPLIVNSDGVRSSLGAFSTLLISSLFFSDSVKDSELEGPLEAGTGPDGPVDRQEAECAASGQVEGSAAGSRGRSPGSGRGEQGRNFC